MSSGTALLKQLQLRKRQQLEARHRDQQLQQLSDNTPKIAPILPASSEQTPQEPNLLLAAAEAASSSASARVQITVCTGINCGAGGMARNPTKVICGGAGAGTSAALIEIEELVAEHSFAAAAAREKNVGGEEQQDKYFSPSPSANERKANRVRVVSGGCTDHCTVGPNVFVQTPSIGSTHFTRVESVSQCATIMECATGTLPNCDISRARGGNTILQTRAEGLRWKALRELVRAEVNHSTKGSYYSAARERIQAASDAEYVAIAATAATAATTSDPNEDYTSREKRAARRSKRLLERLNLHHF